MPQPLTAVAEPAGGLDLAVFAQYGVLGILVLILIYFAKNAHQRERDRADRLEAEVQRLHELMLDRVIPALTAAAKAAEESSELMNQMQRERALVSLIRRHDVEGGSL